MVDFDELAGKYKSHFEQDELELGERVAREFAKPKLNTTGASYGQFETKDSGERLEYDSGMRRDIQKGKPRFDLLLTEDLPFEQQFLTRFAALLERGAIKYGERNWQLANSEDELSRFRASALRHMMQWACGEEDEDHAVAVAFNLMAYEFVKCKLNKEN